MGRADKAEIHSRPSGYVRLVPLPDPDNMPLVSYNSCSVVADEHSRFEKSAFPSGYNLYQDLEMTGRLINIHEDISYDTDVVDLHSHIFLELLCCVSGEINYLIGTDRYQIRAGDTICIPPGVSHRPLFPDHMNIPYIRTVIWINPELIDQFCITVPEMEKCKTLCGVVNSHSEQSPHIAELFQQACLQAQRTDFGWQAWICADIIQLIIELTRIFEEKQTNLAPALQHEILDDAIIYVENHLSEKISLEDAARSLLVSQSAISQTFRKNMGISFYRFVTLRRLTAAKNLIMEGSSLADVAAHTGYADYSTFYRAFKQEYGISPSEFRDLTLQ